MLKLKDEIDLKELEKFGFKPYYNCDTGEIDYWYKKIYDYYFTSKEYSEYTIEISDSEIYYYKSSLFKKAKTKEIKNRIMFNMSEKGSAYCLFFDTLFDLIQAGLVEKIEE